MPRRNGRTLWCMSLSSGSRQLTSTKLSGNWCTNGLSGFRIDDDEDDDVEPKSVTKRICYDWEPPPPFHKIGSKTGTVIAIKCCAKAVFILIQLLQCTIFKGRHTRSHPSKRGWDQRPSVCVWVYFICLGLMKPLDDSHYFIIQSCATFRLVYGIVSHPPKAGIVPGIYGKLLIFNHPFTVIFIFLLLVRKSVSAKYCACAHWHYKVSIGKHSTISTVLRQGVLDFPEASSLCITYSTYSTNLLLAAG